MTPTPESGGVEIGDWPTWGAFILASISLAWQFFNEWRSSRKQKLNYSLSRIEAIMSIVTEIRTLAMSYWLQPENVSARDGLMLVQHLRELSVSVSRYEKILWHGASTDVLRLKVETTGANFQVASRSQLPPDDPFIKKFMATAADLDRRLKDLKDDLER
ncbi:hypothetical protein SAMN05216598_3632 [Pseudomonas asplenii]|uniref:Uncharacterized protein n=1 Tax=Pseudomonas asplenii TaxID=53407 RepID=A0A1H1WZL1_9PSED|nr:hypothetical protein [Pseudomonas asplenii]SDT01669.1 hypothetical protein SAMN05216598_3632 [Pseudomonas asplenii]